MNSPTSSTAANPSADADILRARARSTAPIVARHRLGIVYNARSGRHKRIAGHALPAGVPALAAHTFDEIGAAVARLLGEGVDVLAVAGGDGTVRAVLSRILLGPSTGKPPLIAIVPTGSTNMTAADAGWVDVRGCGWAPLMAWLTEPAKTRAEIRQRSVLRIRPHPGEPVFCGMFFGAGAIHHAVEYTQHRLHRAGLRGNLGPAVTLGRFVKAIATGDRRRFTPIELRASDDQGRALDQPTLLFAASTLHRLVLRFDPFWGRGDGALRWTAIADDAAGLVRHLPGVAWGRPGRGARPGNGYRSYVADAVDVCFDGGFVVDGECYAAERAAGPVRLSIAGRASFLAL